MRIDHLEEYIHLRLPNVTIKEQNGQSNEHHHAGVDGQQHEFDQFGNMTVNLISPKVQCVNGTFTFTTLNITQNPLTLEQLAYSIDGLEENGIRRSFQRDPYRLVIYSR